MSNLLLDEEPLIILPLLAKKIGLNESIVLQQLHYWLKRSKHFHDGYMWIYNTYEDWQIQFPFWSVSTIRRTISKLEKDNFIIVSNYNRLKIDNTKWYRINYSILDMNRPSVHNEQTECSKRTDEQTKLNRPLPETTTENTTEKEHIPFAEIISYLNEKSDSNFRATTEGNKKAIRARWSEGYRLENFKTVIEYCCREWKGKTFANGHPGDDYLKPSTLFNQKFDERLNKAGGRKQNVVKSDEEKRYEEYENEDTSLDIDLLGGFDDGLFSAK